MFWRLYLMLMSNDWLTVSLTAAVAICWCWPLYTHTHRTFLSARRYTLARYLLSSRVRPSICLSVCLSQVGVVPKWLKLRSRKQRRTVVHGRHLRHERSLQNSDKMTPTGAPNAGGVGKKLLFWPIEKSPAQTPNRRKFVSTSHGGPRQRRCAGGGIRGDINNVGCRGSLLITRTAYFRVTCMWHGASHARWVTVEPIATTRVLNYAGSRIRSGSCWNCCSRWHAICLHYSYKSRTFQLIQNIARVSRRLLSLFSLCWDISFFAAIHYFMVGKNSYMPNLRYWPPLQSFLHATRKALIQDRTDHLGQS